MASTRIGDVVDHVRQVTAAAVGEGWQVLDGPLIGELMDKAVVVGFTESVDRPGYTTAREQMDGYGRPSYREDFTVRCLLTIASGDTDLAPLRDQATTALAAIEDALRAQHVAAGVWNRAGLTGDTQWIPLQDPNGAAMNVIYTVEGTCLL